MLPSPSINERIACSVACWAAEHRLKPISLSIWLRSLASLRVLLLGFWGLDFALSGVAAAARGGTVAITFDDLPALSIEHDQAYIDRLTLELLRKLKRHRIVSVGFVNEGKLEELDHSHQIRNLQRWLDAGMELGNHTYSHASLNEVGLGPYIDDLVKGEVITARLLAQRRHQVRYFRPPYLETGKSEAIRGGLQHWLDQRGYTLVPVTIDADDWEFAEPYDDAIARRDKASQRHIRDEYLAHTARRVHWAQQCANLLFGRDIAHIMLLHATKLNADTLDGLRHILRRSGLHAITLETALRDSVYKSPSSYTGPDGIDWLERWASVRKIGLPSSGDEDPPADIIAAYKKVDDDVP